MKKTLFFVFLFLPILVTAQIINFPDINLKNRLLASNSGLDIASTNWDFTVFPNASSTIAIDSNGDGEIEVSEALQVSRLKIQSQSISNLTGLEYFTNLRYLLANDNLFTQIDVSNFPHLQLLFIHNNHLSNIDLSNLTEMIIFYSPNNQFTSLDFSGLTNLKAVYCGHNQLTSLDFSSNPVFNDLGCSYNPNLTSINLKNNQQQVFGAQTWYNECWGNNPSLTAICADDNEIVSIQSFLQNCGITQPITVDSVCALNIQKDNFNQLAIYPNPVKGLLQIDNQEVIKYQLFNAVGVEIKSNTLLIGGSIDCLNLSTGFYILNLENQSGEKKVVKVLKE